MHVSTRQAFKILTSRIHPQLPLSPRESEQLLALLTTSFRQHLDREHPLANSHHAASTPPPASTSHGAKPVAARLSSFSYADKHLESILTNPLFAVRPSRQQGQRANDTHLFLNDPLRWFEQQVASGSASIEKAYSCLVNLRRLQRGNKSVELSGSNAANGDSKNSEAGWIVLSWLWSSGAASSNEFLTHRRFVGLLADYLIAERRQHVIWNWFEQDNKELKAKFSVDSAVIRTWKATVFHALIKHDFKSSPDVAISRFTDLLSSRETSRTTKAIFNPAGMLIVDRIAALGTTSSLNSAVYDRFSSQVASWTSAAELVKAVLWLHHPSKPDANPSLEYLKEAISPASLSGQQRTRSIHLCLEAARQLIVQGRHGEAQWVLEYARESFPDELGSSPIDVSKQLSAASSKEKKEEARNMESLEALSVV